MFYFNCIRRIQNGLVGTGLLIILLGVSPGLSSQTGEVQIEAVGESVGQSFLGNDELLRQAESILNRGVSRFQADQRELTIRKFIFTQAQERSADFERNKQAFKAAPEISSLEMVKRAAERGRIRFEEAQQFLELVEVEKISLQSYIAQINSAQTSAEIFSESLMALDPYLLRIRLRVADGSLVAANIPDAINEAKLRGAREDLIEAHAELDL